MFPRNYLFLTYFILFDQYSLIYSYIDLKTPVKLKTKPQNVSKQEIAN